ncbi:MAG: hypothetical protein L0L82_08095, partial [Tetragenococcus koreensis]|nr:hypothetical protein [Tetragenococcus koreensis]
MDTKQCPSNLQTYWWDIQRCGTDRKAIGGNLRDVPPIGKAIGGNLRDVAPIEKLLEGTYEMWHQSK